MEGQKLKKIIENVSENSMYLLLYDTERLYMFTNYFGQLGESAVLNFIFVEPITFQV